MPDPFCQSLLIVPCYRAVDTGQNPLIDQFGRQEILSTNGNLSAKAHGGEVEGMPKWGKNPHSGRFEIGHFRIRTSNFQKTKSARREKGSSIVENSSGRPEFTVFRAWFKKGSGTIARTARRVLRTKVPDPFLNHAVFRNFRGPTRWQAQLARRYDVPCTTSWRRHVVRRPVAGTLCPAPR